MHFFSLLFLLVCMAINGCKLTDDCFGGNKIPGILSKGASNAQAKEAKSARCHWNDGIMRKRIMGHKPFCCMRLRMKPQNQVEDIYLWLRGIELFN